MKKLCRKLLVLLCVFAALCSTVALAEQDSSSALDVVIVLDASPSLIRETNAREGGRIGAADDKGYRLDAAALMTYMCETEKSRVAFIVFNTKITSDSVLTLQEISDPDVRNALVKRIMEATDTRGETNLGPAMQEAVRILRDSDNPNHNQQMILLLTDGAIYVDGSYEGTKAEASLQQTEQAVKEAAALGIRIYTIPLLGQGASERSEWVGNLRRYAETTLGESYTINNDPGMLPEVFGRMFAKQIGSNMIQLSNRTKAEDDLRTVDISIPNRSVAEANIIIPMEIIKKGTEPALQDSHGKLADKTKTEHFYFYKLINPEPGTWKLEYEIDASNVSNSLRLNLLYNYNVQMHTEPERDVLSKTDSLVFTTQYYTNGRPSDDEMLYLPSDTGERIMATYQIFKDGQEVGGAREMDVARDRYTVNVPLKELGVSHQGVYEVRIKIDGGEYAGLQREDSFTFTVNNAAPKLTTAQGEAQSITINDPRLGDDMNKNRTITLDVAPYFADDDLEPLTYAVTNSDIEGTVQAVIQGDSTLALTTAGKPCNGVVTVSATDVDGEQIAIEIPVEVISVIDEMQQRYRVDLTIDDQAADEQKTFTFDKNQTIQLQMKLLDDKGQGLSRFPYGEGDLAAQFVASITVGEEQLPVSYDSEQDAFVATFETKKNEATYPIEILATCAETIRLPDAFTLKVTNTPPKIDEQVRQQYVDALAELQIKPLIPNVQKASEPVVIDMAALLTDPNDEVEYTYQIMLGEESAESMITRENNVITFMPEEKGEYKLVVTAKDTDAQVESVPFAISVESIMEKTLICIGLGLLAALIVILLFRWFIWLLKKYFPNDSELSMSTGDYIAERARNPLPHQKKDIPLEYCSSSNLLQETQTGDAARLLLLRPAKDKKAIQLILTKQARKQLSSDWQITLGGMDGDNVDLLESSKTVYRWPEGSLLTVTYGENMPCKWILEINKGGAEDGDIPGMDFSKPTGTDGSDEDW